MFSIVDTEDPDSFVSQKSWHNQDVFGADSLGTGTAVQWETTVKWMAPASACRSLLTSPPISPAQGFKEKGEGGDLGGASQRWKEGGNTPHQALVSRYLPSPSQNIPLSLFYLPFAPNPSLLPCICSLIPNMWGPPVSHLCACNAVTSVDSSLGWTLALPLITAQHSQHALSTPLPIPHQHLFISLLF